MTAAVFSSFNLCPINFREFNLLNAKLQNIDACLLYAKLKFHQANSSIMKEGKTWIARSRAQIASWFGFSPKKADRLLAFLEQEKMIEKQVKLWYGKRRLYITTCEDFKPVPVNLKMLDVLADATGSLKSALIFSKIAFGFANSKIVHEGISWCCIKKGDLAGWAGISIRTLDSFLESLLKKGLILKRNLVWREKLQTHFHIPDFAIQALQGRFPHSLPPTAPVVSPVALAAAPGCAIEDVVTFPETTSSILFDVWDVTEEALAQEVAEATPTDGENLNAAETKLSAADVREADRFPAIQPEPEGETMEKASTQNCRQSSANLATPIRIRTNQKETNNNTGDDLSTDTLSPNKAKISSDIIFEEIGESLTPRQTKYLKAALSRTIERHNIRISSPSEFWEQLQFSILNVQQRNGVHTFTHAVSRCLKILVSGNWRTPIGFNNHSTAGAALKAEREQQEREWQQQKMGQGQRTQIHQFVEKLDHELGVIAKVFGFGQAPDPTALLTEKAVKTAELLVRTAKEAADASVDSPVYQMATNLQCELDTLIRQGADVEAVKNVLAGGSAINA